VSLAHNVRLEERDGGTGIVRMMVGASLLFVKALDNFFWELIGDGLAFTFRWTGEFRRRDEK
jgi:hypothetical protein